MNIFKYFKESSFTEKAIHLYIVTLPFSSGDRYLFFRKQVQYSDLVFPIIFLSWGWNKLRRRLPCSWPGRYSHAYFFITIFLFSSLCSLKNSSYLINSAAEWLGLLYLAAIFLIVSDNVDTADKLKRLLLACVAASVAAALAGVWAFAHYLITRRLDGNSLLFFYPAESSLLFFPRIKAFFYTPNMFAAFEHIGLTCFACIPFLAEKGKILNPPSLLLPISVAVIIMAGIILSGSSLISGTLMTVFMLLFLFKNRLTAILRYFCFIFTVLTGLFAFSSAVWMIYPIKIHNDYRQRLLDIQINYAYSHHIIPSIYAISMFKEHPLLGIGAGTFKEQYPRHINMEFERLSSTRMEVPVDRALDPHNTYTGALAEYGMFGFLAMIAVFLYFISGLFSLRKADSPALSYCLLSGLLGFLFNAFFIDIIMMRHLWLFLAVIFIVLRLSGKDPSTLAAGGEKQ